MCLKLFVMCTCQGDITELIVSHFLWSFSSKVLKLIKLVMNFVAVLPDASNTHSVQEDWTYWTQREGMLSISLIYCSTSYFATIEKVATNTVVSKEAVSSKTGFQFMGDKQFRMEMFLETSVCVDFSQYPFENVYVQFS